MSDLNAYYKRWEDIVREEEDEEEPAPLPGPARSYAQALGSQVVGVAPDGSKHAVDPKKLSFSIGKPLTEEEFAAHRARHPNSRPIASARPRK